MHGVHDLGSPTSHGNTPKPTIPYDAKFFIAQSANKWVLRVIASLRLPPRTPSRKLVDLFQGKFSRVTVPPEAWLHHKQPLSEWLDV